MVMRARHWTLRSADLDAAETVLAVLASALGAGARGRVRRTFPVIPRAGGCFGR